MIKLLCIGFGYSAEYLAKILTDEVKIIGTNRSVVTPNSSSNVEIVAFDQLYDLDNDITHILISIPPRGNTDIALHKFGPQILKLPKLKWLGYLSSTGVYGDHQGEWIDEQTSLNQELVFARPRIIAEKMWLNLWLNHRVPVHIFRLSGIYGPGRSEIEKGIAGQTRIIEKPNQVFCRIHVEDIAQILKNSMQHPTPGEIYNISDDFPCSHAEVVYYVHELLQTSPPFSEKFEKAEMSDMMRYFYSKSARISNKKIKEKLQIKLLYPTYKDGIKAIWNLFSNQQSISVS